MPLTPLVVKISLLPSSKPVFSRVKLGEKLKEVERGRKAVFFYRVPVIQSPCGHLLYSGSCSPSIGQGWGVEGSSWFLGAKRKENLPIAVLQAG